jgi:hypothetical protein
MDEDRYATVLIGVLKTLRDLRLVQEEGWYRIPVEHLPSRGSTARYIAFYQPSSFGAQGGVVRYFAAVRAWELLRRRDILPMEPDHPHADELYYRVGLGELQRLSPPIHGGRWRRFSFIVTHWERLQQARELRDLLHGTLWEEKLWSALQKAGMLGR